jgi:hypothetical protein
VECRCPVFGQLVEGAASAVVCVGSEVEARVDGRRVEASDQPIPSGALSRGERLLWSHLWEVCWELAGDPPVYAAPVDDHDENKPVWLWPTWAVGVLSPLSGVRDVNDDDDDDDDNKLVNSPGSTLMPVLGGGTGTGEPPIVLLVGRTGSRLSSVLGTRAPPTRGGGRRPLGGGLW